MPCQVLHILGTAQPEGTGIARIVSALASGLDPERYHVHVWFLGGDGPLAAELEAARARVRVIHWWRGARDPVGAWRFWRGLCGEEFSIVHQHFGGRSVRWLARAATRARIVLHLHGHVWESQGPSPVAIPVQGADVVIAASRAIAEHVVGVQPHVVYAGVRVPDNGGEASAVPRTTTGRVIGTAGRLVPIKGIVYLVHALAVLRAEFPDLRLEIAGSGPERPALENEVQLLGLADCVTFLGWRADIVRAMTRWDVFVLPSLAEGFGITALEAMAAGLPIVATAVDGIPELVEDGRTGWLVPPGDPAALAERLHVLLLDPEQRRAMGAAGRARAQEHFSIDRMVTGISKIYDDILR